MTILSRRVHRGKTSLNRPRKYLPYSAVSRIFTCRSALFVARVLYVDSRSNRESTARDSRYNVFRESRKACQEDAEERKTRLCVFASRIRTPRVFCICKRVLYSSDDLIMCTRHIRTYAPRGATA